jgi:hypothetical protein
MHTSRYRTNTSIESTRSLVYRNWTKFKLEQEINRVEVAERFD